MERIYCLLALALCILAITPAVVDANPFGRAYENTLTVYGNANLDEIIDENDVEYVRGIITSTEDATQFADANYDGKIDEDDIAQIELIIAGEEEELTILDMSNRTVTVPMPVERIISTSGYDITRTLVMLDATDKIASCAFPTEGEWSPLWYAAPQLVDLPDTRGPGQGHAAGRGFNIELAVSLDPDVIFLWSWEALNADEIMEKSQVPTIVVGSYSDGLWAADMFRIIGAVTGKDKKARDLINYTKEQIDEIAKITSEIPDEEKPLVYATDGSGKITRCCGALSVVEWAGGLNAVEYSDSTNIEVSKEQVIKWNPDVILLHFANPEKIEAVISDPVLQDVNAVKNGRVYSVRVGLGGWGTWGSQLSMINYLAKLFHPDEFEDLDVEERNNEIMEHFYGVDGIYTDMIEEHYLYKWD